MNTISKTAPAENPHSDSSQLFFSFFPFLSVVVVAKFSLALRELTLWGHVTVSSDIIKIEKKIPVNLTPVSFYQDSWIFS